MHIRTALAFALLATSALPAAAQTLCGDDRLVGIPAEGPTECPVTGGVSLISAGGTILTGDVVLTCELASRLADWIEAPAMQSPRAIRELTLSAPDTCGSGHVVDVEGFRIGSRWTMTVAEHWEEPVRRGYLDNVRAAAANRFDEVLTPYDGAEHATHFRVSVAP